MWPFVQLLLLPNAHCCSQLFIWALLVMRLRSLRCNIFFSLFVCLSLHMLCDDGATQSEVRDCLRQILFLSIIKSSRRKPCQRGVLDCKRKNTACSRMSRQKICITFRSCAAKSTTTRIRAPATQLLSHFFGHQGTAKVVKTILTKHRGRLPANPTELPHISQQTNTLITNRINTKQKTLPLLLDGLAVILARVVRIEDEISRLLLHVYVQQDVV
jgi:hypothetical protein